MTRWYGGPVLLAVTLPLSAVLYVAMTLDSARRHYSGRWRRLEGTNLRSLVERSLIGRPPANLVTTPVVER